MIEQRFTLTLDKKNYFPGETIKGTVYLNPEKPVFIEDILISFNIFENWYVLTSGQTQFNNQIIAAFYIGIKKMLGYKANDTNIYLEKLKYTFPFTYKLPEYINPSFEYPTDKYRAFLRYNLSAKIISKDYPGITSEYIVIQAIPKNDLDNLNKESTSSSIKKWGLFSKGNSIVKAFYPTKNYKFGDTIPITINVDNTNSKLKLTECKIDLIRKISFKDKENLTDKYTHEDKLIKKVFKSEVKKKEKQNFEFKIPLLELNSKSYTYNNYKQPYNNSPSCCIESIPSVDGGILKCEYYLKITAYYDSFVTKAERPRIILPVYMVHKVDGNIVVMNQQESEDLRKAIEESKREEEELKRINEMEEEEQIRRAIEESKKEEERNELQRQKLFMSDNCNFDPNNDELLLPTKSILERNKDNKNEGQNIFNNNNNNINNFSYPSFDFNNRNNYSNNNGNNNGNNSINNINENNNINNINENNNINFNNNNNNNNFNNNDNNFSNNGNNLNNNGNKFNDNNNNNNIFNNNNSNNFNNNNSNNFNNNNNNNFNNDNGNNFNNNINNNNDNNFNPNNNNNNNNFNNYNNNNFNNCNNNNNYNNGYNGNNNQNNNNNFNNNNNNNPNIFKNFDFNNNNNSINNNNFNNNFNNNNYNNQNNNMNNMNSNNNNFNNNNFNNNNFNNNIFNNNNFNNNNFNNNNFNNSNFNNNNSNNDNSNNSNFKDINEIDDDEEDINNFNLL